MIPARKSRLFTACFAWDAERRIRRSFEHVHVHGLDGVRAALALRPALVVTNHTAWWDPLVAIFLSIRVLGADAYAMMDATSLTRLPFFAKVGAFGVNLRDPADGARAIRYAAKLLRRDHHLVWIFAQGREVPITVRPLDLRPGAAEIARISPRAAVVPGALRYEMGRTRRPSLWVSFGEPLSPITPGEAARETQERAVTRELDRIDRAIASGDGNGFASLHARRSDRWLSLAEAALAAITRSKTLR